MENILQIIQTLGFPIACVVACGFFIYNLVNRDKDEAKAREDRLIDANEKTSMALNKVADTIEETNVLNKELSETNRLLVERVDGDLSTINTNIDKILDKLNN